MPGDAEGSAKGGTGAAEGGAKGGPASAPAAGAGGRLPDRMRRVGKAFAGLAVAAGALLILDRLVVTDAERIESLFDRAEAALEAEDAEGLVALLDPDAFEGFGVTAEEARAALADFFSEAEGIAVRRLAFEIERIERPDAAAVVQGFVTMKFRDEGRLVEAAERGTYRFLLRWDGQRWRFARAEKIAERPLGSPP